MAAVETMTFFCVISQVRAMICVSIWLSSMKCLKIVNGYEDVDRNMFFKLKEGSRTRGHKAALVKEQCRLDMRKYSFSQRVINEWNKLPNDCVNASSVNMFKNRIDSYLKADYT